MTGLNTAGRSAVLDDGPPRSIRRVTVGPDPDPRTATRQWLDGEPASVEAGQLVRYDLWETGPTSSAPPPPGEATAGMPGPGQTQWRLTSMGPGLSWPLHGTDTVDHTVILAGSVAVLLEEGEVVLEPGDLVVIPGVLHGWRAGPQGCTLAAHLVGRPPTAPTSRP